MNGNPAPPPFEVMLPWLPKHTVQPVFWLLYFFAHCAVIVLADCAEGSLVVVEGSLLLLLLLVLLLRLLLPLLLLLMLSVG